MPSPLKVDWRWGVRVVKQAKADLKLSSSVSWTNAG